MRHQTDRAHSSRFREGLVEYGFHAPSDLEFRLLLPPFGQPCFFHAGNAVDGTNDLCGFGRADEWTVIQLLNTFRFQKCRQRLRLLLSLGRKERTWNYIVGNVPAIPIWCAMSDQKNLLEPGNEYSHSSPPGRHGSALLFTNPCHRM